MQLAALNRHPRHQDQHRRRSAFCVGEMEVQGRATLENATSHRTHDGPVEHMVAQHEPPVAQDPGSFPQLSHASVAGQVAFVVHQLDVSEKAANCTQG